MMSKKTLAYKGFDKNMQCRGFQFEVGKTYQHKGNVELCNSGFHACENPLDVWGYYSILDSRFALVELSGKQKSKDKGDSKIAAAKIEIKAELSLPEFINKAVQRAIELCKGQAESGDYAQIGSSGGSAQIGSSGGSAQIGSSGGYARIGSSGGYAQIGSSGGYAQIGSSGYSARIKAEGKNSVIASAGCATTASGAKGTWISLAEFKDGKCVGFAIGCIGKDGLKPGIKYTAKGGKLVPLED
jgi:hypothetical protein